MASLQSRSNFERCCRLCAQEHDVTVMIFSDEADAELLQKKLHKYLLIDVDEDDKLPKNICIQCYAKLQSVCEFIDTAHEAQKVLINRSLVIDMESFTDIEKKSHPFNDDKITTMEISVDPMMVLQNSDGEISSSPCNVSEDVTHLDNVDRENVTLKLIKIDKVQADESDDDCEKECKPFSCKICKRSFYSDLALKSHTWTHTSDPLNVVQRHRCHSCEAGFDYKGDLVEHLKEHKTNGMCQLCGRVFRSASNLAHHLHMHLSKHTTFTCKVCGRSYHSKSNLKNHSVTHSTERPYKCHLCKKGFKRNQELKFHINQHTGAKPYKCPFCDKCFASSGNCYSHRSRMHPERVSEKFKEEMHTSKESKIVQLLTAPKKVPSITNGKSAFKYQCTFCDHTFVKRDNYMYHMYQHTGEKPFHCSFCPEKFVTRQGLLIHHDRMHPKQDRPLALLSKNALLNFPKDPARRREWMEAIKREEEWIPTKHAHIYSSHFSNSCFVKISKSTKQNLYKEVT